MHYGSGHPDTQGEWQEKSLWESHTQHLRRRRLCRKWPGTMADRFTARGSRSGTADAGMQTDAKRHRDLQETKCWGEEGDLDFHEDMISVDSRGQMAALWLGSIEGWPSLALGRAAYGSSSRPCGVCWLLSTCL